MKIVYVLKYYKENGTLDTYEWSYDIQWLIKYLKKDRKFTIDVHDLDYSYETSLRQFNNNDLNFLLQLLQFDEIIPRCISYTIEDQPNFKYIARDFEIELPRNSRLKIN